MSDESCDDARKVCAALRFVIPNAHVVRLQFTELHMLPGAGQTSLTSTYPVNTSFHSSMSRSLASGEGQLKTAHLAPNTEDIRASSSQTQVPHHLDTTLRQDSDLSTSQSRYNASFATICGALIFCL